MGEYKIKQGDTLSILAKKFGLKVDDLVKSNNIKNPNFIRTGSILSIPGKTTPSVNSNEDVIKHYIEQMIASGNKDILLTDKGTKSTYYGKASDYKGDLKNLKRIEVLTGVNDNPYDTKYTPKSPEDIDKMSNPNQAKLTPIGRFQTINNPDLYGTPGLSIKGMNAAYHTIYPGELKERLAKYKNGTLDDNNVSYGCVNCYKPDLQDLLSNVHGGDSTYIIDSRLPLDALDKGMQENTDFIGSKTGRPLQKKSAPSYTVQPLVMKGAGITENPYEHGGMIEEERELAASGIHIKPSHRGRFTAYLKRTGKTMSEALNSKDPHVRQMANFARNAKKWKHEDGGRIKAGGGELILPQNYNQQTAYNWQQQQQIQNPYIQQGFDPNHFMMDPIFAGADMKKNSEAAAGVTPNMFGDDSADPDKKMDPMAIAGAAGKAVLGAVDVFTAMGDHDKPFNAAMTAGSTAVKTTDKILAPIDNIPGAKVFTAPIKALSFGIGALVGGFKKKIENTEEDKAKALTEYYDRNLQPITADRGEGRYGISLSSVPLEKEIHADFDNMLKNRK